MQNPEQNWQIIDRNTPYIDESNWIEEEDRLLNFAENPIFEKQPLNSIAFIFLYKDLDNNVVGVSRTTAHLDKRERYSILHRAEFADKVNVAKTPNKIYQPCIEDRWIEKQYQFEDAGIYCVPVDSDNITEYEPITIFLPLQFSKDIAKISSSLIPFHDLYEILVIMREDKPPATIKSILKDGTKMGRTKKVRISDESPNKVLFYNSKPVAGKRRTNKIYH